MVATSPERLRNEASTLFEKDDLPAAFAFVVRLSALHQRMFIRDLTLVLTRLATGGAEEDVQDLFELIEGWEATADMDSSPETAEILRAPKDYRPLKIG